MVFHKTSTIFDQIVFQGKLDSTTFVITDSCNVYFFSGTTIEKAKLQLPYEFVTKNITLHGDRLFVMYKEHILEFLITKDNDLKEVRKIEVDCAVENDDTCVSDWDESLDWEKSSMIDMCYSSEHGSLFTLVMRVYKDESFPRMVVQRHKFLDSGDIYSQEEQIPWTKDTEASWMDSDSDVGYGCHFFIAGNMMVVDNVVYKLHFIEL